VTRTSNTGANRVAKHARARRKNRVVALLGCVVAFATAAALMVPAISMTKDSIEAPEFADSSSVTQTVEAEQEALSAEEAGGDSEDGAAEDDAQSEASAEAEGDSSDELDNDDTDAADANGEGEATDDEQAEDPEDDEAEEADLPAQSFYGELRDKDDKVTLTVDVEAPEGALPAGTTMQVEAVKAKDIQAAVEKALAKEDSGTLDSIQAVDITFLNAEGEPIEPAAAVNVKLASKQIAKAAKDDAKQALVAHITDKGKAEMVDALTDEELEEREIVREDNELLFDADSFSVYAIVYTVDFHWEIDGKKYEFTIPGGGFASLTELVDALGVLDDANSDGNDAATFVSDVASVKFSDPELVWVGKADEATTVGALKKANNLKAEYSAELTDKQIEEIDAQTVGAGDWALISLKAFNTQESLTVTMKDGEAFTIRVTDAQIKGTVIADSGDAYEVAVTYDEKANIPEGSTLRVTEFKEDSEAYAHARNAVLADKKARGEQVNLGVFNLAALDISILNPAGQEIEPAAAVQVDIRIKELPGVENLSEVADTLAIQHHVEVDKGVVVETVFDGGSDASFKMKTDQAVASAGNAVDPDSVTDEDFAAASPAESTSLNMEFDAEAFSTFTISWNYAYGNGTKIHYVDESGNELSVANTTLPTTLEANSTSPAYLIYDIDGYEYSYTYRNNANKRIYPQLIKSTYYGWGYYNSSGNFNFLNNNDEIYVVYKEKAHVVPGGTPTVKQSSDVDPPVDPRINKESTPNGDDTNTLALSLISDTAKLEVERLADVIVVFDVSGSMKTDDMGNNTTRLQAAKKAVNDMADELSKKTNSNGDPLVRMSLIQFSTKASTVLGMTDLTATGLSTIQAAVNRLSAEGGTNWDHALQLANEENDLDSGRATFVIFVTDGDPTFRNTRMDVTDADLQGETNDNAWNTYGQLRPNPYYLDDNVYGPADNDKTGQCYAAAVNQGTAIVGAGKNIYTIGISNDVTKVQTFNTDIGGNGAYIAANSSTLQQAFKDIEASIAGASGWGNIKMTDGITNLSNTVQKTGLTNVGGDFTYWIAPAPANWDSMTAEQKNAYTPPASAFVEWDPEAAGAALAQYNEDTGAVEWNMGSTFMPEGGVTYQVRFKVWPSQEAYDYIAKLNNGTISYDSLDEAVKAQIIKNGNTYTLKTNEPNANTTYQSATKTGSTVTVSGDTHTLIFPSVEDLNLSVDKLKVEKKWVNGLDPDARWTSDVTLLLTDGNGNLYKSIDLNEQNNFTAEDNFISCGLAKIEKGELVIYERGHDFQLTEPENYAYYWDLDSQVYRPMIIDAQLTMLVKTDAPSGMGDATYYVEGGTKYYKIGDGVYKAVSTGDSAATITATNIRRSNLNLTKTVVDENDNPAVSGELFGFTITVNDPKDADVWFSVQTDANDTSTIVKDLTTNATAEMRNGEKTGFYHAASGSAITVSLKPGWNLRFTNLPNGTTYTISETAKEGYTFHSAVINSGDISVNKDTATASGTISESNTQYTVTYTNKAVTKQVYIYKTDQDGQKALPGAEFSLYTKAGYEADPKEVMKADLVSGEDGKVDLGRLAVGEYRLVETTAPAGYILLEDPVEITVTSTGVTYTQNGNTLSQSSEGVIHQNETDPYTLTVTNNAGYELPSTGGPGTWLLTIAGSILVLAAAALLLARRIRVRRA